MVLSGRQHHDWPRCLLYAFPPLPLLDLMLLRVLKDGHRLLLVIPLLAQENLVFSAAAFPCLFLQGGTFCLSWGVYADGQEDIPVRPRVKADNQEVILGRPEVPEVCNKACQEASVETRRTRGAGGPEEGYEGAGGGAWKAQNHGGTLKSGA
ncbi:hypothetical protein GOODEAATRI_025124 [Goodea atripinnis]|uniref:Uncharacterized protein n=1 Tax=Goodea atripinnis TaxID=208336 RepID=A0ABV0P7P4_9TELE